MQAGGRQWQTIPPSVALRTGHASTSTRSTRSGTGTKALDVTEELLKEIVGRVGPVADDVRAEVRKMRAD